MIKRESVCVCEWVWERAFAVKKREWDSERERGKERESPDYEREWKIEWERERERGERRGGGRMEINRICLSRWHQWALNRCHNSCLRPLLASSIKLRWSRTNTSLSRLFCAKNSPEKKKDKWNGTSFSIGRAVMTSNHSFKRSFVFLGSLFTRSHDSKLLSCKILIKMSPPLKFFQLQACFAPHWYRLYHTKKHYLRRAPAIHLFHLSLLPAFLQLVFQPLISAQTGFSIGT